MQQRDLSVGEHAGLGTEHRDGADRVAVAKHGHRYDAAIARYASEALQTIFGVLLDIRKIHNAAGENGAAGCTIAARSHWVNATDRLQRLIGHSRVSGPAVDELTVESVDPPRRGATQLLSIGRDCFEHRLHAVGRLVD